MPRYASFPSAQSVQPRDREWLTAQTERAITFFNARKAIREGRDPEGVKAKLRAAGFDFSEDELES
jgi:hypothetical protein